ncbi:hypothetical protein NPX13_g1711 [Xylaria arbuscula]|uniref:Clr5 domain-containing protein n=1 Tax=Xylaria arbuscula TaxID=114810 RepID=A0A9W8NLY7_9PEZI|nr:hypothetical protein NPX13_g1711 [Xylaria arbuscula]
MRDWLEIGMHAYYYTNMSTQLVPITGINGNRDFSLFEQHEPKLRQLFLQEDKSLTQVKREMETHHGFPKTEVLTSAKIYEYTFRHLKLVKKLGVEQWVQVDAHVRKRKREGKETEVLLSGVPQPLAKIARAISRHKRGRLLQDRITKEPIPDCPEHVLLRTPPSSPYITTTVPQHDLPHTLVEPCGVLVIDQQTGSVIDFEQLSAYIQHQMMPDPGSTLQRLVDVPSSQPILVLANDVQAGRFLVQEPPTPDPRNLVWDSAFKRPALRYFLDALSKATINMANNARNSVVADSRQLLGWVGADTKRQSLRDFFSSNLPALAASWPEFISLSEHLRCGDAFRALVEVGLTLHNGKWIKQHAIRVINSMVWIGSAGTRKIRRQLLSYKPIQERLREYTLTKYAGSLVKDVEMLSTLNRVGARLAYPSQNASLIMLQTCHILV